VWAFDGAGVYASVADHFVANRIYFTDDSSSQSYCKLEGKTVVDASSGETQTVCTKFVRYIDYSTTSNWIVLYEQLVAESAQSVDGMEEQIQDLNDKLTEISDELNLVNYFSKTPELLRELACYWVEGDYSNENIALLDSMTTDEMIDLSYELMDAGSAELSMMSQPRYTFSLQANHVLSQYEFRNQMAALSLGCSVSVEKEDGAWYYPTLLEMSFSLDDHDTFNLVFANALRLDDWGYTYAELIAGASSTSRQVSSNWYDLTSYKREKDKLSQLIESPLDATLRASIANSVNQEFTVDNTGILGRKSIPGSTGRYEDEQLRMINNLLIFTEDGWETAKTALGKIYWIDPETQEEHIDYGLVAETIIGSLVMSERLKIVNADSSVHIGADGIQILDSDGSVVFHASADGSIMIKSYVSAAELKAFKVTSDNIEAKSITADKINTAGLEAEKIQVADADGNTIFSADAAEKRVVMSAVCITGRLTADQIETEGLSADKIHVTDTDGDTVFFADASSLPVIIGGFNVNNTSLFSGKTTYQDDNDGVYIGTEGVGLGKGKFYVTKEGKLTATDIDLRGKITATDGSLSNLTLDGFLYFGGNKEYYVNANHRNTDYYIKMPGLIIDDEGTIFDGTITAREGELQNLTIGGRLSFGGNDSYYINTSGSGDDYYINLPNFTVNDGGAVFGGELSAPSGKSGGFDSESTYLYASSDDGEVYIGTDEISLGDTFVVTNAGKLTAADADISGKITSTDGKIGGWNITVDGITKDVVGLTSGSTYSGDSLVTANTTSPVRFYAGKGYKTFYSSSISESSHTVDGRDVTVSYVYNPSNDVSGIGEFEIISVLFNNISLDAESTVLSITYSNGEAQILIQMTDQTYEYYEDKSICCAIKYVDGLNTQILEDGSFYAKAADIEGNIKATSGTFSNCTIDDTCVINGSLAARTICSHTGSYEGHSAISTIESLANNDFFESQYASGYDISARSTTSGDTSWASIIAAHTYGKPKVNLAIRNGTYNSYMYIEPSMIGISARRGNDLYTSILMSESSGQLIGTWSGTVSTATSSDVNAKNSITDMDDRYGMLFDYLRPRIYKYNDGLSGRLHTGFVAQEVDDALTAAGIDRSEFAAVCISNQGTATEQWSLRYDEFIALNVREIQKLKARVAELEAKLKERGI
jgi:hypothetical protein